MPGDLTEDVGRITSWGKLIRNHYIGTGPPRVSAKGGWRLVYDPSAVIDHFRGPRFEADRRESPENAAIRDRSFNLVAGMLTVEPELLARRAAFGLLVGDRESPGIARAGAAALRREWEVVRRLPPSLVGQAEALIAIARGERVPMLTFAHEGEHDGARGATKRGKSA
jgi:hypothetical protein